MFFIQLIWLYLVNWDTELFHYLVFFKLLPRARLPLHSGSCTYLHQLRSLSNNIFEETWMSCTWKRMRSSEYKFCMWGPSSSIWRCNNKTLLAMLTINNYSTANFQSTCANAPQLWGCRGFQSRPIHFAIWLIISILIHFNIYSKHSGIAENPHYRINKNSSRIIVPLCLSQVSHGFSYILHWVAQASPQPPLLNIWGS